MVTGDYIVGTTGTWIRATDGEVIPEQGQKILKGYSRDGLRRLMKLSNGGARLIVGWPGIAIR